MAVSLLLLLLLCSVAKCDAEEYYVTPTPPPNPNCPVDKTCECLSYYTNNSHSIFTGKTNVSLLFLEGTHDSANDSLDIKLVPFFTMAGFNVSYNTSNPQVKIKLAIIKLSNMTLLTLADISLQDTVIKVHHTLSLTSYQVIFTRADIHLYSWVWNPMGTAVQYVLKMEKCLLLDGFYNFTVPGATTFELLDNTISNSTVIVQAWPTAIVRIAESHIQRSCFFVGASSPEPASVILDIEIIHSYFNDRNPCGGFEVDILGHTKMNISQCYFEQGLAVSTDRCSLHIESTTFSNNGAKIIIMSDIKQEITLQNVSFVQNTVDRAALDISGEVNATIDTCFFDNNVGVLAGALYINTIDLFFIGNSTFSGNTGTRGGAIHMLDDSILWLSKGTNIVFSNNNATQKGGAIYVSNVCQQVIPDDNSNNSQCFYQLTFDDQPYTEKFPASVTFEHNTATNGGNDIYRVPLNDICTVYKRSDGDFVRSIDVQKRIFHFKTPTLSSISSCSRRICLCANSQTPQCANLSYIFYEGTALPGQTLSLSVTSVGDEFGPVEGEVYAVSIDEQNENFFFSRGEESQVVKSDSCTTLDYTLHLKKANVSRAEFMLSKNLLFAGIQRGHLNERFSESSLNEAIQKYKSNGVISPELLYSPVVVRINISTNCPLGFDLYSPSVNPNNPDYVCRCDKRLDQYVTDHSCTVKSDSGTFNRIGTNWLGIGKTNNSILACSLCPFGYCKDEMIAVNVYKHDSQCDLNRSGVLCGRCADDFSLAIGSSACIKCTDVDNKNIALLIAFIGAGIALVVFIKILDITVAHGTINGLILYANLIWINSGTFFPSYSESNLPHFSRFFNFLRGFTAWLNLDFGIQACLFQGLDAYVKTWLQFVFPAYVCGLIVLIILICRYSQWATRLFQKNAVPVLATLLLLSYVKLLRNVVNIFSFAVLQEIYREGRFFVFKWLLDGNIDYFQDKHAVLFVFGAVLVLIFYLPFTALLLFKRCPSIVPLACFKRLLFKLKPLLDAYTGPLKDKHRYWVGLTLLARVILGITTVGFQALFPKINIVLLGVFSVVLSVIVTKVYKRRYVLFLEILFLFNLILLCFGFLVTDELSVKVILTSISTGITFLVFAGIIMVHMVWLVRNWRQNGMCRRQYQNIESDDYGRGEQRAALSASDIDYRCDYHVRENDHTSF